MRIRLVRGALLIGTSIATRGQVANTILIHLVLLDRLEMPIIITMTDITRMPSLRQHPGRPAHPRCGQSKTRLRLTAKLQ